MKEWKKYTTIAIDDFDLKKRLKMKALEKDVDMIELIKSYIEKGLESDK